MLINTLKEFAIARGIENPYQLHKKTGLDQSTSYRLWRDPEVYPSKENTELLCAYFKVQPGEFTAWVADEP